MGGMGDSSLLLHFVQDKVQNDKEKVGPSVGSE